MFKENKQYGGSQKTTGVIGGRMNDYIQINYEKEKTVLAGKTLNETLKHFSDNPKKSIEWKIAVNRLIVEKTRQEENSIWDAEVAAQLLKNWSDFDTEISIEKGVIQRVVLTRKDVKAIKEIVNG